MAKKEPKPNPFAKGGKAAPFPKKGEKKGEKKGAPKKGKCPKCKKDYSKCECDE